jgi:hypothetical protein
VGLPEDSSSRRSMDLFEAQLEQLASFVELSSVNGPLRLTLPSDAKASIEATTVHGGIEKQLRPPY